MRKVLEFKLEYREEGEEKSIAIKIDFVSYRILNDFGENEALATRANYANNQMAMLEEEIAIAKAEEEDEIAAELQEAYNEHFNFIMSFNDNGFFDTRFGILKKLLIDNGYKDHEKLMSRDFWENSVDPFTMAEFMRTSIYKDTGDNKKKVVRK